MGNKKNIVIKENILRKEYSYSKNGVKLSFTLRIDNSSELRPFKDCLQEAVIDLTEQLEGMKN